MIAQIKKYRSDLVVSDVDVVGEAPDLPYITYDQYMDPHTDVFEPMDNAPIVLNVQLKALSAVKNEAKEIAYWLSKLYTEQQPSYELQRQSTSLVVQKATMIPPTRDDLTTGFIFTSGVDLQIELLDGFTDDTQAGQISSIDVSFINQKKEE